MLPTEIRAGEPEGGSSFYYCGHPSPKRLARPLYPNAESMGLASLSVARPDRDRDLARRGLMAACVCSCGSRDRPRT